MNLPADFIRQSKALMGEEMYGLLEKGLSDEVPTSIRLNPFKCNLNTVRIPLSSEKVPWCAPGHYLAERPNFTFDPLLHAGLYYVQEASSMFLHHVLRQTVSEPVVMLDLCAAPGGKSTVSRTALPAGSLLFSNEPMRQRAQILGENIKKFGHPDVIVTNNYADDYARAGIGFDVILADVPCSGEGMFRKDEGAISEWSIQNVDSCSRLQRDIVAGIWPCLKPGGILIYSTCTFNSRENEENVAWIASELGAEFINIPTEEAWNISGSMTDDNPVYRFLPGKTRGEGLFMAVLRKTDDTFAVPQKAKDKHRKDSSKKTNTQWLKDAEMFDCMTEDDKVVAIPLNWSHVYAKAIRKLKIIHAGITIGTMKGKDLIPDHSLALSTMLDTDSFTKYELNYKQAIDFLRKEPVVLPANMPRRPVLMTYNGVPLGFEKNLGNRANNLYPQEWRIKSSHIPETNNNIIEI